MPFLITVTNDPARAHLLRSLTAAHEAYLERHLDGILAAGPLKDDTGTRVIGGMILLDVETRAEAEAFFAQDPLTIAGLRGSVTMTRWDGTFFAGRRGAG